jgi:hypothetical protein
MSHFFAKIYLTLSGSNKNAFRSLSPITIHTTASPTTDPSLTLFNAISY